jgi:cysteine desulfuration protein SufE
MTIKEIQDEIIEDLNFLENKDDKNDYIFDLGKELSVMLDDDKSTENFIHGCQSNAWIHSEFNQGKMTFTADSDALFTKGMIALILRIFSGQEPESIIKSDLFFMDQVGMEGFISQKRTNGLLSMIDKIRLAAAKALTYKL